jgi:hypothetical protein
LSGEDILEADAPIVAALNSLGAVR